MSNENGCVTETRRPRAATIAILIGLCAALLLQANWAQCTSSITYDETYLAGCAQQTAYSGRLDQRLPQNGTAPLPVLVNYLLPAALLTSAPRPDVWASVASDVPVVTAARRLNALTAGLSLLLLVFVWLARRRGLAAGTVGAALLASCPTILTHISVAGSDALAATTMLAALAVLAWHAARPSRWRLLALTAAIAVACATKYSAAFLGPVSFLVLTLTQSQRSAGPWVGRVWRAAWLAAGQMCLVAALGFPLLWALHLFGVSSFHPSLSTAQSPWLTRPAPVAGVLFQFLHNRIGHPAFLMGQHSNLGWWYYFPCALFFKSTPAELLLALVGVLSVTRVLKRSAGQPPVLDVSLCVWLCAGAVYLAMLMASHIGIGQRYALLLYPLLFLVAVDQLWQMFPGKRARAAWAAGLLGLQVASAAWIAPQYLAYFSPLVGGPQAGHRLLVDSNIDWGQDLIRLRPELDRLGYNRVLLKYFGTASLQAYGVDAVRWDDATMTWPQDCEVLVVSVTFLQGVYTLERDPFRELREIPPLSRAGYSLWIYDLQDPAVRQALHAARRRLSSTARGAK
jgi:4-amino-4-deoxy-L-arabinose transferase-like glycosyltransferase